MTFDPTTNRAPYDLLTTDEKLSLSTWPHGWQFYSATKVCWVDVPNIRRCSYSVYRGKPAPVVASVWVNVYNDGLKSRTSADAYVYGSRVAVLRIDTCNGVSTAHIEEV